MSGETQISQDRAGARGNDYTFQRCTTPNKGSNKTLGSAGQNVDGQKSKRRAKNNKPFGFYLRKTKGLERLRRAYYKGRKKYERQTNCG